MYEKIKYTLIYVLLVLFIITGTGLSIQTYRLEQTRQQLESARIELAAANNRQSDIVNTVNEITDRVGRTREILSQSVITAAGIREQIGQIRTEYEQMEILLLRYYSNNDNVHNTMEDKVNGSVTDN